MCQAYRTIAPTLLPAGALENTFPKSYQDGVLTIGVYESLWAQQVQMKKHTLLQLINQKFQQQAQEQQKSGNRLTSNSTYTPILQSIRIVMAEKPEAPNDFLDSPNITAIN